MLLLFVIFVMHPLGYGFYVMFLLLVLAVQWFQAMMLLLLVLPSSLVVASYDGLFACDFHHAPLACASL